MLRRDGAGLPPPKLVKDKGLFHSVPLNTAIKARQAMHTPAGIPLMEKGQGQVGRSLPCSVKIQPTKAQPAEVHKDNFGSLGWG